MYKTSKETKGRKDVRRQFILDTAVRVFAQNGYHNTAVRDIVEEAAVSVGSFYFYFNSKEVLFTEIYRSIAKEFQENAGKVLDIEYFPLAKNFTRVMMADYYLINDWLESDEPVRLTDSGYALCVYNLQALGIPFENETIRQDIQEVLDEMDTRAEQNQ